MFSLQNLISVASDAFAIKSAPGTASAQAAEADLVTRASTVVSGLAATSPKAAAIVESGVTFAEQVAQHPNPGQLVASGLNILLTAFGSSVTF